MPLRKIADRKHHPGWHKDPGKPKLPCQHPEHNPPGNMLYEPGATYEYECPGCGKKVTFTVPIVTWSGDGGPPCPV